MLLYDVDYGVNYKNRCFKDVNMISVYDVNYDVDFGMPFYTWVTINNYYFTFFL